MTTKHRILIVTTLALVTLGGCPYGGVAPGLYLTQADNGSDVTREVGQLLYITLPSNFITAFTWQLVEQPDAAILEYTHRTYVPPNFGLIGTPGMDKWEFTARGEGTVTVQLEYVSTTDATAEPTQTYSVTVTVTPAAAS